MIRLAKVTEIPQILDLTRACGAALRAEGIFQWTADYPSETAFRQDVDRGELWVLETTEGISGTMTLSETMDREYEAVRWLTPQGNQRYLHRLGIHPALQGKGLAQQLMDHAERMARQQGAVSIRLDTFSRNARNQRFYEMRGYHRLGAVYFPGQSPYPFYCYEGILSSLP